MDHYTIFPRHTIYFVDLKKYLHGFKDSKVSMQSYLFMSHEARNFSQQPVYTFSGYCILYIDSYFRQTCKKHLSFANPSMKKLLEGFHCHLYQGNRHEKGRSKWIHTTTNKFQE